MGEKKLVFIDETLRDGAQSLWSMFTTYGVHDAVCAEMDKAGYHYIHIPVNIANFKVAIRFYKENPWESAHLFKQKFVKTKKIVPILERLDLIGESDPRCIIRMFHEMAFRITGASASIYMANARNELDRYYPWIVPIVRELGLEFQPMICYYPSPRNTDEYYAKLTKRLVEEYQPERMWLKDAGGLMSVERLKTLLPAIQKEAKGTPIDIHTHGMSTNHGRVVVEAMKMGIDGVHTCIPPMASGSSHVSIFNAIHNAKVLGLQHCITDVEALKEVERRLRIIGKLEDLPEGVPLEYDHGVYTHQVPGGVISNLRTQLGQLGIAHKLEEVLEEVVRIIDDMGNPIMITPASQFIVTQAAVNVATGERYKEVIDPMIETAMGAWGWEDAGVPWMDPNVKDRFLGHRNAKILAEKYEKRKELESTEGDINKIRAGLGMTHASDEDFMLHYIMKGEAEIKKIRPPKTYYTGKEPLVLLLKELSKDHDISRLQLQKGKSFFEYRRK